MSVAPVGEFMKPRVDEDCRTKRRTIQTINSYEVYTPVRFADAGGAPGVERATRDEATNKRARRDDARRCGSDKLTRVNVCSKGQCKLLTYTRL